MRILSLVRLLYDLPYSFLQDLFDNIWSFDLDIQNVNIEKKVKL